MYKYIDEISGCYLIPCTCLEYKFCVVKPCTLISVVRLIIETTYTLSVRLYCVSFFFKSCDLTSLESKRRNVTPGLLRFNGCLYSNESNEQEMKRHSWSSIYGCSYSNEPEHQETKLRAHWNASTYFNIIVLWSVLSYSGS